MAEEDDLSKGKDGDEAPGADPNDSPEAVTPPDVGSVIEEVLKSDKEQTGSPDVVLVLFKLDDSTSIGNYGYKPMICENHNKCLADLRAEDTEDWILVATETFHGYKHNKFVSPRDAKDLTVLDYPTVFGTPLNLQVASAVLEADGEAEKYRDKGMVVRIIIFILSDGLNTPKEEEHCFPAQETNRVVTEGIAKGDLIVLALGVKNGAVDFYQAFGDLGIPKKWITVCEGDPIKVQRSLDSVTRVISSSSSSRAAFHDTQTGGLPDYGPDS